MVALQMLKATTGSEADPGALPKAFYKPVV
jgi:hypothetical protein